jgi:hypothetical protein
MIAAHLIRKQHAKKWQVHYLFGMLHERYLMNLPRLKRDKNEWCDTSSLRLRWLWCQWVGKLLGWKESRLEGHPNDLSAEVYTALREKVFPIPKVERDVVAKASTAALAQPLLTPGGSTYSTSGCCLHSGRCAAGTFGSGGAAVNTGAGCVGSARGTPGASGSSSKHLPPGFDDGSHTRRAWLEGMHERGYLDDNNAIIWSANPALGLPAWSFWHLVAVIGTPNPVDSDPASGNKGDTVCLEGAAGCSFGSTASTTVLPRSAGRPLPVESGCQIPIFPTTDLVVGGAAPFVRSEYTWQNPAAVSADNSDVLLWCSGGIDSSRSEGRASDAANFIDPIISGIWSPRMADRNAPADTASGYSAPPE